MNNGTISERRTQDHFWSSVVISFCVATLCLLCLWTIARGSELSAAAQDEEERVWAEMGSGSASGGGISANDGYSRLPSLAISASGTHIIAWQDDIGDNREIYVRRWNGAKWVEMGSSSASGGGISDTGGDSWSPSAAFGSDGAPIIAWEDVSGNDSEIYVRRWNGSSWVQMGSGSASGGGISDNGGDSWSPSMAVTPDGTPIVAWEDESAGDSEIYVRRWNGTSWVEMGSSSASGGGISNNSGTSAYPSLAVSSDGTPIIAWEDDSSGDLEIYLRRWNGTTWVEMGSGSASGGGVSNNDGDSWSPSLAANPSDTPIVAWEDESEGNAEIYVRRWNGTSWVEIGSSSASGGGISNNSGISASPSIAVSPDGTPAVAWEDDSHGDAEIYVRGWNGTSWEELGSGSASANNGDSWSSSLAFDPDNRPIIAWADDSGSNWDIFVRRWQLSSTANGTTNYLPVIIR